MSNLFSLGPEYSAYETSHAVSLPVPFERSTSWIRGCARGPDAVIEASAQVEFYDIETDSQIYTQGIHTAEPVFEEAAESMIEAVRKKVGLFLNDKKLPVLIGGEHTVSIGAVMACRDHFPGLNILHLDAHADRRVSYNEDPFSHASVIARIKDIPADVVSVGIRSMDHSEKKSAEEDAVVYAHEAVQSSGWIERVADSLSEHVYATIDMDVFDPSFVPSVGTPEPGGLDWYTVTGLLKNVCYAKQIVGFDIVELCPGENKASDFTAAKLIYKLLSYIGDRNRWTAETK